MIPEREFFTDDTLVMMGLSRKQGSFSRHVYNAFRKAGLKVFPVNINDSGADNKKIFNDITKIESVPKAAYVLMKKENAGRAYEDLKKAGIKKIMFHSKGLVDPQILTDCKENGIETAFGCPMMIFGGGIHKFHKFLAGLFK